MANIGFRNWDKDMTTGKSGKKADGGSQGSAKGNPRTIDLEANDITPTTDGDAPDGDSNVEMGNAPETDTADLGTRMSGDDSNPDAPRENEAAKQAPVSGVGFGRLLASGFAGGVISLFAIGGLNQLGVLQSVPLLSGLSARVTEPVAVDNGATDALKARLDDVAARLAQAETKLSEPSVQSGQNDQTSKITILSTQLDDLFKRVGAMENTLAESKAVAPAGLTSTPSDTGANADSARIGILANQMDDLFKRLKIAEDNLAKAGASPADGQPVADPAEIAAMKVEIEDLRKQLQAGIADTTARLASETETLDSRIGELSGKLETMVAANDQKPDSQEIIAKSVAATALRTAYDRGEPFAPLLASVETLVGSQSAIESLKPYATTGVMTNEQLKSGFSELVDTMLASVAPKEEGIAARLMANAKSLVSVRPAGPVEGNTPQAIVSRIEADLASGSLASALGEWENLPDPAKAASGDWAEKLQARIKADELMMQVSLLLSAGSAR